MGVAQSVIGLDWDETKVAIANGAAIAFEGVEFHHADIRTAVVPAGDTVLLIDILHYLTHEEQDAVLRRAARAARERVIVRDVDPDRGASSTLTRVWESFTTAVGYNRGARVLPRSFGDIARVLESEGFVVQRDACTARGMSNSLLIARRPAD
jgi:hypothetical protein